MKICEFIFNLIKKIMCNSGNTNSNNTHIEINQDHNSGNISNNINNTKDKYNVIIFHKLN